MIQRIQTVFLFLAAICGFSLLGLPFAKTPQAVQTSALFADAKFWAGDNIGLIVLFAVAGALAIAALAMFKNRLLQIKLSRVSLISGILGLVLAVLLFWMDTKNLAAAEIQDGAGAYLPFGFLLFVILAIRFIRKDEALVKSTDRLR
ncbi:MAG: DUF4293 domain-containing protein [Bacteroidota bacterium]